MSLSEPRPEIDPKEQIVAEPDSKAEPELDGKVEPAASDKPDASEAEPTKEAEPKENSGAEPKSNTESAASEKPDLAQAEPIDTIGQPADGLDEPFVEPDEKLDGAEVPVVEIPGGGSPADMGTQGMLDVDENLGKDISDDAGIDEGGGVPGADFGGPPDSGMPEPGGLDVFDMPDGSSLEGSNPGADPRQEFDGNQIGEDVGANESPSSSPDQVSPSNPDPGQDTNQQGVNQQDAGQPDPPTSEEGDSWTGITEWNDQVDSDGNQNIQGTEVYVQSDGTVLVVQTSHDNQNGTTQNVTLYDENGNVIEQETSHEPAADDQQSDDSSDPPASDDTDGYTPADDIGLEGGEAGDEEIPYNGLVDPPDEGFGQLDGTSGDILEFGDPASDPRTVNPALDEGAGDPEPGEPENPLGGPDGGVVDPVDIVDDSWIGGGLFGVETGNGFALDDDEFSGEGDFGFLE